MGLSFKKIMLIFCLMQLFALPAYTKEAAVNISPLLVGQKVSNVNLKSLKNKDINFLNLIAKKPAVVVFFMGGWCPYCNIKLSQLKAIETAVTSLGYQIIAISPDTPARLVQLKADKKLNYSLFSDQDSAAAKKFGVAFRTNLKHQMQFKVWQSTAKRKTKEVSQLLPIPSVFLIDKNGKILYEYVNIDYRVQLSGEVLLTAARVYAKK